MPRKKRLSDDAEQVALYLTPEEKLALDVIRGRRKKRGEQRTTTNEIVADSLWKLLVEVENVPKEEIQKLFAVTPKDVGVEKSKVKVFPKNDKT